MNEPYKVIAVEEDRAMLLTENKHVLRDKDDLSSLFLDIDQNHRGIIYFDNDESVIGYTLHYLNYQAEYKLKREDVGDLIRLEHHMELKISQSCPFYKGTIRIQYGDNRCPLATK